MMHMTFWYGIHFDDLLVKGLDISTVPGFVAICFGFLSMTLMFEGIKVSQEVVTEKASQAMTALKQQASMPPVPRREDPVTERSPLLTSQRENKESYISVMQQQRLQYHALLTFLHMVQILLGYVIMLAVMTYNVYVYMSIVIGSGLGYFFFGLVMMSHSLNISCIPGNSSVEELYSPAVRRDSGSARSQGWGAGDQADASNSVEKPGRHVPCHKKQMPRRETHTLVISAEGKNTDDVKEVKSDVASVEGSSHGDAGHSVSV